MVTPILTTMLPDLPKQHKKKEADFGVEFRHWWERNPMLGNFELKHVRDRGGLPFNAVEPEQVIVGKAAAGDKGVLLRLVKGTIGSPDYVGQVRWPTWIVIRYPKSFSIISLEIFLHEKKRSEQKSLTAERAMEIAIISVKY